MTVFNLGNNDVELDDVKWEKSNEQHLPHTESLDCPISKEEVAESIRKLKQGKASGLDNMLAEMLKSDGALLTHFLTEYFNEIF